MLCDTGNAVDMLIGLLKLIIWIETRNAVCLEEKGGSPSCLQKGSGIKHGSLKSPTLQGLVALNGLPHPAPNVPPSDA